MSFTLDPTVPQDTESPRQGASRIRTLTGEVLELFGESGLVAATYTLPPIATVDKTTGLATVQGAPTVTNGIATKGYVDAKTTIYIGTASGTNSYSVTLAPVPANLAALQGVPIYVVFTNANTGSASLNCNSLGAITIRKFVNGTVALLTGGEIPANSVMGLIYDGTQFQLVGMDLEAEVWAQSQVPLYCTISNGGSGSTFTGSLSPAPTSYVSGQVYFVKWTQASQGSDTINLNGIGAINVKKYVGSTLTALAANDIPAGAITGLNYDGTQFQIAVRANNAVLTFDRVVGNPAIDVVSSTAETTIYTKSVPGNTLGTDGAFRLIIIGDVFNNSGATRTIDYKVKFGGTTVIDSTGTGIGYAINGNRHKVIWETYISNLGATNSQHCSSTLVNGSAEANGQMGVASTSDTYAGEFVGLGIDTTTAQTLAATVTLSANSANLEFRLYAVYVQLTQA